MAGVGGGEENLNRLKRSGAVPGMQSRPLHKQPGNGCHHHERQPQPLALTHDHGGGVGAEVVWHLHGGCVEVLGGRLDLLRRIGKQGLP